MSYNFDFEKVKDAVDKLTASRGGHQLNHALAVLDNAVKIAAGEDKDADMNIVALMAILHDVDDYKFGGTDDLSNARQIMTDVDISEDVQAKVCKGINEIGFGKRLRGVVPESIEAKIVSDADMVEAGGISGIKRMKEYKPDRKMFDRNIFPRWNVTAEQYNNPPPGATVVNHIIEKQLRIKDMMLTKAGREFGERNHNFYVGFLYGVFEANGADEWHKMLDDYLGEDNVF